LEVEKNQTARTDPFCHFSSELRLSSSQEIAKEPLGFDDDYHANGEQSGADDDQVDNSLSDNNDSSDESNEGSDRNHGDLVGLSSEGRGESDFSALPPILHAMLSGEDEIMQYMLERECPIHPKQHSSNRLLKCATGEYKWSAKDLLAHYAIIDLDEPLLRSV
jgi:hypothetical protein